MKRFSFLLLMTVGVLLVVSHADTLFLEKNVAQEEILRIGFSGQAFTKSMVKDAEAALGSLADALNEKFSEKFRNTTTEIIEDSIILKDILIQKKVDVVGLVALDFIQLRESVPFNPFLVSIQGGNPNIQMILLVRKNDPIRSLAQLKDKDLIVDIVNKEGLVKIWLDVLFRREDLPERDIFLNQIKEVEKASQAILPVFFEKADACLTSQRAFNTMVELNPQVGERLRILYKSPKFLSGVVCVRDDMSENDKNEMVEIMQEIHTYPEGEQLMMILQIDQLIPYEPVHLETTQVLVDEHRKLVSSRKLERQ